MIQASMFEYGAFANYTLPPHFELDEPELNLTEPDIGDFGFKLTGMEDLQNCLADLLAHSVTTPTTEAGSSAAEEESSRPSTPEVQEAAPLPVVAAAADASPKKGWGLAAATQASAGQLEDVRQTSVTVQNVPKKCTRDLLAKALDEAGFSGDYDLIYVTADLKQRNCGSGAALVNFRSEEACAKFTAAFHKTVVATVFPGLAGKKALEVAAAPAQGLEANVCKLERSGVLMSMLAERPGWRPARYNEAGQIEAEIGDDC
jgi:hypothetical protein